MKVRPRRRALAPGFAALALTVTGCAAEPQTEETDQASSTAIVRTPVATAPQRSAPVERETPAESPSTQSPAARATESRAPSQDAAPEEAAAGGIRGDLLTGDEVPGFNNRFTWRAKATTMGEGRQPFGTCHRFAMTSIGATKVTVRTYAPARKSPGSTASNLVAEFADRMTAKRAYAVLQSWREQCADRLRRHERSDVGGLEKVSVGAADGTWYLLRYGPAGDPDSFYFDAQGLTRVGRTVSVLQMRLVGQDYNYRSGQEPMVAAVQHAVARIG